MAVGAVCRSGGALVVDAASMGGLVREFGESTHNFGVCGGDDGISWRGGPDSEFGG